MTSSRRAVGAWVTAGILALIGLVVLIVGLLRPVTYGWFAYQPLADATFTPGATGVFFSRVTIVGCVILTIGLIALAFLAGWQAGAKRARLIDDSEDSS